MKKGLLAIGIMLIVLGVLSFLLSCLFAFAATHTLDGSADLYRRQWRSMIIFMAAGVILLNSGIVCLVLHKKAIV